MSTTYAAYQQLIQQGRAAEALALAERAYLEGPARNPFWLNRQAAVLGRLGRWEQALEVARKALDLAPNDPFCLVAAGDALAGLQRWPEACVHFEAAAAHPRTQASARRKLLGGLLAINAFERMELLMASWELTEAEKLTWQIKLLSSQGAYEAAMQACRRRLSLVPDDPSALWELTELEIRRDGLEAVRMRMGRLAKIASRPPIYKEIYASLCRRAGRCDAALQQYRALSRTGADPRIQRKEAFVLAKSGREAEAIPIMEELLRQSPQDVYLHNAYQGACRRAEQMPHAAEFYQALIDLYPEQKNLYGRLRRIRKSVEAQG